MHIKLLYIFILVCLFDLSIMAQAPGWQWAKEANSPGDEQAWDIAYDNFSGNTYVGGKFTGTLGTYSLVSFGQSDGFVAKYDPLGNILWTFKIGGSDMEEIKSIGTDDLGNVYVAGYFRSICDFDPSVGNFLLTPSGGAGNQDCFLAKYDGLGNFVWATKFGNNSAENVWRLFVDVNGVYLTGNYSGNVTFNSASPSLVTKVTTANQGDVEFFGAKYNFSGVVQWVVSGASQKDDIGFDVVTDNNNAYFIGTHAKDLDLYNASGTFASQLLVASNNRASAFVVAYSQANGTFSWATNMGSATNDCHGGGITQDAANLYITGFYQGTASFPVSSPLFSKTSTGNNDMYLAKIAKSSGVYQWVSSQTPTGGGDEEAYEIVTEAGGNLVVAGFFNSTVSFTNGPTFTTLGNEDIILSAYNPAGNFLWANRAGANNTDLPYGLTTNTTGGIYVAGEHANATVFGSFTLTSGGQGNIFVAKTGCELPTNNVITASQTICTGNAPSSLSGTLPTNAGVFAWQQSANNSTWTAAAGTATNQNYSPPPLTSTSYYRRLVAAGGACTNTAISNTVIITVDQLPTTSNASANQTICVNTTTVLNGNAPSVGTGSWSVLSGTASIITPTLSSSSVTGTAIGNNVLRWSISNGVCAVSSSTMLIRVLGLPRSLKCWYSPNYLCGLSYIGCNCAHPWSWKPGQ